MVARHTAIGEKSVPMSGELVLFDLPGLYFVGAVEGRVEDDQPVDGLH